MNTKELSILAYLAEAAVKAPSFGQFQTLLESVQELETSSAEFGQALEEIRKVALTIQSSPNKDEVLNNEVDRLFQISSNMGTSLGSTFKWVSENRAKMQKA
jgi:hypothetical protein